MRRKQGIPVLKAEHSSKFQWKAWCPYCVAYHYHGSGGSEPMPLYGHVVAHCIEGPFRETGYYLKRPD
jgi:hypothetical protein